MQLIVDLRADAAYLKLRKGRMVLTREVAGLHVDQDAQGAVLGVEVLGWTEHLRHFGLLGVLSPLFQSAPETSPNAHTANFSP